MRKLPEDLENPFDNLIYKIVESVAPTLYEYGFTPNILTTLGNISTLTFLYFMLNYQFQIAAFFFLLSYIFDCLDGYIARLYNMETKFDPKAKVKQGDLGSAPDGKQPNQQPGNLKITYGKEERAMETQDGKFDYYEPKKFTSQVDANFNKLADEKDY